MRICTPRLELNFFPSIVRNSLEATLSGSLRSPRPAPYEPPDPYPSRMLGQITVWKTMLSLPMKYVCSADGLCHHSRHASGVPRFSAHSIDAERYPMTASNQT